MKPEIKGKNGFKAVFSPIDQTYTITKDGRVIITVYSLRQAKPYLV
jgi:hypothetical protein